MSLACSFIELRSGCVQSPGGPQVNGWRQARRWSNCCVLLAHKLFKQSERCFQLQTALQVIKVGTSSLVRPDKGSINISNLARLCETVRNLRGEGEIPVVVEGSRCSAAKFWCSS